MASVEAAAILTEAAVARLGEVAAKLVPKETLDGLGEFPLHSRDPKLLMADRMDWVTGVLSAVQLGAVVPSKTQMELTELEAKYNALLASNADLAKMLETVTADRDRLQQELDGLEFVDEVDDAVDPESTVEATSEIVPAKPAKPAKDK